MRTFGLTLLAATLLLAASTHTTAQETGPITETRLEDGTVSWSISASAEVNLDALLRQYSDARGMRIQYDPRKLAGAMLLVVPADGQELQGQQIDLLVQSVLNDHRIALTGIGTNYGRIILVAEAHASARTVAAEEMDNVNPAEWVNCTFVPTSVDSNSLRGALQSLSTAKAGAILPTPTGGLIICDRGDRVREILKAARGIDQPGPYTRVSKRYDLADGIEPAIARDVVLQLFTAQGPTPAGPASSVEVAVVPNRRAIIIRARVAEHSQIAAALDLLR